MAEKTISVVDPFIVETTYEIGMTKYGYGQTKEQAVQDSLIASGDVGEQVEQVVWQKTDRTRKTRYGILPVYKTI